MKLHHLIGLLVVVTAIGITAAGCGGGGSSSSSTTTTSSGASSTPASAGGSTAVRISNFKFVPAKVTVGHGTGFSVTNRDSTAHTATADDGHSFDTGNLDPSSSKTITVAKAGNYPYHCTIHSFMHGTLVVT
jgi:plastocyanin